MTANMLLAVGTTEARSVVAEALRHNPGLTARRLAGQESVPLWVVTEALKDMEAAGTASRTPGPTKGNRKSADLWEPTTRTTTPPTPRPTRPTSRPGRQRRERQRGAGVRGTCVRRAVRRR